MFGVIWLYQMIDKQFTRLILFSRICTYTNEARIEEERLC